MTDPVAKEAHDDSLFKVFGRIGLMSFGGPAGQIALMHRVLVEEKRWLSEQQFLHALNFCMVLPGPEAMQLATYAGWLKAGLKGGLIAGLLFVLPGAAVVTALAAIYAACGNSPVVSGLLFGLSAAVLAVVLEALGRVAKRALKTGAHRMIALAAFVALAVFGLPFPIVIAAAALAGALLLRANPGVDPEAGADITDKAAQQSLRAVAIFGASWFIPLALLIAGGGMFAAMALFFSKAAIVTFGGAYAVLAYVGQQAVEVHGWLTTKDMVTGLGLAETTPGPLILVLVFVGYLGGFNAGGGVAGGLAGAATALWFTFAPCFLWVFAGAPFMERLRSVAWLSAALAGVTAAVVGVIANLALWFGLHVLFGTLHTWNIGPMALPAPDVASFDWRAGPIAVASAVALLRLHVGLGHVLAAAAIAGVLLTLS